MQSPTREQVALALFTLLESLKISGNPAFVTTSRRPQLWASTTSFPALYMGNPKESYEYQHGTSSPAHITLDFDIFIYINVSDPNVTPDTQMNSLIDAIEAALQGTPATNGVQSLGGIVDHCWIEGSVLRAPGYLNGQGMALMTIRVLVPFGS